MTEERTLRRLAKALVGGVLRLAVTLSSRKVGVALLYHSVEDSAREPDDVLVPAVAPAVFAHQVQHLRRRYLVVPASELQAAASRRRRGGRIPVAITFDDDDRTHATTALPLLRRAGLTATFFLNGSSLDRPTPLWWRQLQAAWDRGTVDGTLLAALPRRPVTGHGDLRALGLAITELNPAQRARVSELLEERAGRAPGLCGPSAAEVRKLVDAGFEVGFHTRNHDYLPLLHEDELRASLVGGRDRLEAVVGRRVTTFSYPSGGTGTAVREAVRAAGYRAAFTTESAPVTPSSDPVALGRISPPPGNVAQLSLAIARTAARVLLASAAAILGGDPLDQRTPAPREHVVATPLLHPPSRSGGEIGMVGVDKAAQPRRHIGHFRPHAESAVLGQLS
jgi:peptidoglycan/xylan/chitin deacetylase (PgdA/CDA1 family)